MVKVPARNYRNYNNSRLKFCPLVFTNEFFLFSLGQGFEWLPLLRSRMILGSDQLSTANNANYHVFAFLNATPHSDDLIAANWNKPCHPECKQPKSREGQRERRSLRMRTSKMIYWLAYSGVMQESQAFQLKTFGTTIGIFGWAIELINA